MTNSDKEMKDKFNEELNQVLFKDLDFDEKLKQKVRKKVKIPNVPVVPLWRKKFVPLVSFAAIICFAIISTLFMQNNPEKQTIINNEQELSLFSDNGYSNSVTTPDHFTTWEVSSLEDVRTQLTKEVLLPTSTAESFTLERIVATGEKHGDPYQVVLNYEDVDRTYVIIIEKHKEQLEPNGFDTIDINGVKGFIKSENYNDHHELTELIWRTENYDYSINGLITNEEALKIAKSFR